MNYMSDKFRGVIVALYACYDHDGEISARAVKRLARYYLDSGVKGLYVGGSSGEGMLQSVDERKLTLEAVMEEVGGKMTVIAHVGAPSTRDSVRLSRHAEAVGADAISAVPSIYYRLSAESVEQHWQAMIDSTSLPFIIYHIPQTTGFQLPMSLFKKMAAQDKVIGIKISAESTYELQQFKAEGGRNFLVFNGPDEQYVAGRSIGADGGIGGTYGVMPELFMKIEECCAAGWMEEARLWQSRVNEVINGLLSSGSLYGACKAILQLRGLDCGKPRKPLPDVPKGKESEIVRLNETILKYTEEIKG